MNIETDSLPKDPADQLRSAKQEAHRYLLADDITYAVLQEKLFDSNVEDADYPDFSVEPTLQRDASTQSTLGLRIKKSRFTLEGEASIGFAHYEYIELGKLDRETALVHASPELKGLITSAGFEKDAILHIAQAWQQSVGMIGDRMGDLVTIDPRSHTIELKSNIERTAYSI